MVTVYHLCYSPQNWQEFSRELELASGRRPEK